MLIGQRGQGGAPLHTRHRIRFLVLLLLKMKLLVLVLQSCEIFETYFCSRLANLLVTVSRILPGSCLGVMVDEVAASKDKNLSAGSGSLLTISRCGRQTSCPSREGDSPCHQPSSCLFLIVLFTQDLSGSRKPRR